MHNYVNVRRAQYPAPSAHHSIIEAANCICHIFSLATTSAQYPIGSYRLGFVGIPSVFADGQNNRTFSFFCYPQIIEVARVLFSDALQYTALFCARSSPCHLYRAMTCSEEVVLVERVRRWIMHWQ